MKKNQIAGGTKGQKMVRKVAKKNHRSLKGRLKIVGDIVGPLPEKWNLDPAVLSHK